MEVIERLTEKIIIIDGKHYRLMTDEECADFIWKTELTDPGYRWPKCKGCAELYDICRSCPSPVL